MEIKDWEALKAERRTQMIAGFTLHGWRPMSSTIKGRPTGLLCDDWRFCMWSIREKRYKVVTTDRSTARTPRMWHHIRTEVMEEFYKCVFKELPWASSLIELAEEETSD